MKKSYSIIFLCIISQFNMFAQVSYHNFFFEGKQRSYIVYLPQDYINLSDLPVVLNLHGLGGDGKWEMDYTAMNNVADTSGFIVVYPSAIDGTWNSGISDDPNYSFSNTNDVVFFSVLIDTLYNQYKININRVYVCGFSNGGLMANKLACQLGTRIAAVASVSGTLSNSTAASCTSITQIPILLINGTSDPALPYNGNNYFFSIEETIHHWTTLNNCTDLVDSISLPNLNSSDGSTVRKYSYKNNSSTTIVEFYKIINGGHGWPNATMNITNTGNLNKDINASVEIWNFIKNFSLSTTSLNELHNVIPSKFQLEQNYPNPFNPTTKIRYTIPNVIASETKQSQLVALKVFDVLGNEVATLVNEEKPTGSYEIEFNASKLSSGIYLYMLQAGSFTQTKKLILMK